MAEVKSIRIVNAAKELNIGIATIAAHLKEKGFEVDAKPTTKLTPEMYEVLLQDFKSDKAVKEESKQINLGYTPPQKKETKEAKVKAEEEAVEQKEEKEKLSGPTVIGKIELKEKKKKTNEIEDEPEVKTTTEQKKENEVEEKPATKKKEPEKEDLYETKKSTLSGPTVVGKIDVPDRPAKKEPVASSSFVPGEKRRRRRKVIVKPGEVGNKRVDRKPTTSVRERLQSEGISEKEIQEKIKDTLAKLSGGKGKSQKTKHKRLKKEVAKENEELEAEDTKKQEIKVTEFVSSSDLAKLMDVSVTDIIDACMNLGMMVSINQRLDAETIEIVADEFGFNVSFVDVEEQKDDFLEAEEEDKPEDLVPRSPIVTVMGHVDHGKTSLLDYIRKTKVTEGEAGGITQHIGAYNVTLDDGKKITFLDTPGHEAFTAMCARGAQVTDIAIIIIAADDSIMPQTKEAISHAQAAGVPMIFAINKIDKEGANPEKIKEALSNMNILVEDWGGKFQSQEISAKSGLNIDLLLEKILLEAELLELKANPNRKALGTIIEASLDKGRGYLASLLVEKGTLHQGDIVLANHYFGKIKAMFNDKGEKVTSVGPASPVQVLGLNDAPQAGDRFNVMENEQKARSVASKREKIIREQGIRTQKHITLDEIGRRLALGNFKELNVIVKGDVDGSVEALADSLQKLSIEEIQVNVIHKSVGQISESDIMLATASDAIVIGFQVRPSMQARKLAEAESIEIRLYSIIYDAIEEIKTAMEGMLEPTVEEKIVCNVEIRETFKISKLGTIAGCQVLDGKITRNTKVRIIREGVVIYTGVLESLKRFKDDVKEVSAGMECGLNIKGYNDIKVGDIIEGYENIEIKRTLKGK